jgi:hypothetical protein
MFQSARCLVLFYHVFVEDLLHEFTDKIIQKVETRIRGNVGTFTHYTWLHTLQSSYVQNHSPEISKVCL